MSDRDSLAAWFRPTWAGGWSAMRILWVGAAALAHGPRMMGIGDVYGSRDLVLHSSIMPLNTWMEVTETHAWIAWAIGLVGLALVAWGGRAFHVGLLAWAGGSWFVLATEAINIKAYDRLLTWLALALLFSPAWRRGLARAWCSPFARYLVLVIFIAIYGSTGLCKLLHEPSWLGNGEVLRYHLVHTYFGMRPLGVIVSGWGWLVAPMAWITVAFEVSFPFLVWLKRANPWALLVGALFHIALLLLMDVGPFGFVSLSAYPVLLHPDVARDLWERAQGWWAARRSAAAPG